MKKLKSYQQFIYLGLIIIAIGLAFTLNPKESVSSMSTVFVVLGGLIFLIGISKKRAENGETGNKE